VSATGLSPTVAPGSTRLCILVLSHLARGSTPWSVLQPRRRKACRLGTTTVWAVPGSLATTTGILSLPRGTLDGSVPPVPSPLQVSRPKPWGCPIRRSWDHGLRATPPRLSQLCHVLHRHDAPRHPPCAHSVFPAHRRGRDGVPLTGRHHDGREGTRNGTRLRGTRHAVALGKVHLPQPRARDYRGVVVPEVPSPLNRA
jgi:hypothetical protein